MNGLTAWSIRHHVSLVALKELQELLCAEIPPTIEIGHKPLSEAAVQNNVRLANAQRGTVLWRNNVGVLPDARGVPVRFGLANDSKKLNDACKSSDLIGIESVHITADMVGAVIGRFVALECKHGGWKYANTPREQAQVNYIRIVNSLGGRASFTTGDTL